MRANNRPSSSSNTNSAAFSPRAIAATMKTIASSDLPVPAGPRISVLDPASTPPPSSWSSSAMPLDIVVRTKLERYSDATSRGNTFSPPVVMVTS